MHSLLALVFVTVVIGLPLWLVSGSPLLAIAVFVGYGSHLFADMMTLGGAQVFWPSRAIAVFPGRDEYRVAPGSGSERVFVAVALVLALLFYPVSKAGFDGLIYRMGGADRVYGRVTRITDGDTVSVEVYGQVQPVRLIGVVRLEIPRIGDSEDAYGRTLAYVYLDKDRDGIYGHLFNRDLLTLGLARTTTFSHAYRREFERLRQEAEERKAGLWGSCPT